MKRLVSSLDEHAPGTQLGLECWHKIEMLDGLAVGDSVDCFLCDELAFPEGLNAYKQTSIFDQYTIPKGFRKTHSTKKGVWAVIVVVSGHVDYVVDDLNQRRFVLDHHLNGIIGPQMAHHLEVTGDVQLYVEFYTDTKI